MTDENSSVLKELILGTLLFGIVVALLGVWWVEDKKMFLIGLSVGTVLSIWRAMHMQSTLEKVLDFEEKTAKAKMAVSYGIRLIAITIVLALMVELELGNTAILMCFVGLFGLKAGAMLQPHIHKYMNILTYNRR
jgi:hypothetical protein